MSQPRETGHRKETTHHGELVTFSSGYVRRVWDAVPQRCGCPLERFACAGNANGEDRLCSFCRATHRPDGELASTLPIASRRHE
jgi:hypothetical protein